jgi:CRISPR/Cas system-associated endoribonuclease Cas2
MARQGTQSISITRLGKLSAVKYLAAPHIEEASREENVTERSDELFQAQQSADSLAVLRRLRIHFKGRVSTTNLRDVQGPLTKVLRAKFRDLRIEIWANETFLVVEVFGAYEPIGGLYAKLAVPVDPRWELIQSIQVKAKSYAIYSMVGPLDAQMRNFLESNVLARVLERVGTADDESLVIYSNQIKARLVTPSFERVLDTIDTILDLIPEAEIVEKREYGDLPPEFAPLIPLLTVWDLSDDEGRWQKVKRSSKATRKRLIETVDPFMAGISAYLDSFNGREMSDSASALDSLAQAAMEADVSLKPQA